jgi:hypothetical protein
MSNINFTPVRSLAEFLDTRALQAFAVGPVGSTKTTVSILKIALNAKRMAAGPDGIRRSRCAIIRNTRQQLSDTTIPDFLKWFGRAGEYQKTNQKFVLRHGDVECEVLFRGLDDSNDVRRLLSLQLSFAMLDEVREINPDVFNALTGRVGRYPDGMLVPHRPEWGVDEKGNPRMGCVDDFGRPMKMIWGATNPPDMDTFWHKHLTSDLENTHVTIQPGGLSQEADWIHLLPSNYYEDLMIGKDEDWIDVYVHGKWGKSLSGKPVFRSFNREFHTTKQSLRPLRSIEHPLLIGLDFGLNPSAVICQNDMHGRLLVHAAITSDGIGLTRFLEDRLRPLLSNRFAGLPLIVIGDPAGTQRAQTDERSCFDILKQKGFRAIGASTNSIVARIAAVDEYLNRQVDGQPGILIDAANAMPLVLALQGGYRYKIKKTGEVEDKPEKNEHSHIADAFQYACLHANGVRGGLLKGRQRREVKVVSARGWT